MKTVLSAAALAVSLLGCSSSEALCRSIRVGDSVDSLPSRGYGFSKDQGDNYVGLNTNDVACCQSASTVSCNVDCTAPEYQAVKSVMLKDEYNQPCEKFGDTMFVCSVGVQNGKVVGVNGACVTDR